MLFKIKWMSSFWVKVLATDGGKKKRAGFPLPRSCAPILAEPWKVVAEAVNQVDSRIAISVPQSVFLEFRLYVYFFSSFKHMYFDNHLYLVIFKAIFVKVIISFCSSFKNNMNKTNVMYLQDITFRNNPSLRRLKFKMQVVQHLT
jgi:hypothetical protein